MNNQPPTSPIPPTAKPATPPPMPAPLPSPPNTPPTKDPGQATGIMGLILAVTAPLIGLVVSALAHTKSRQAGYKNNLATIGISVAIVCTVAQLVLLAVLIGNVTSARAKVSDIEAKTDLATLSTYLEEYYATNGSYPVQLDATKNLHSAGASPAVSIDPQVFVPPSPAYSYAYTALPKGCSNNCSSYALSTQLGGDVPYTIKSMATP